MHIEIKQKFRPFSHRPGIRMPVPFTTWEVRVFPAKLIYTNYLDGEVHEEDLDVTGPVEAFTVLLNLEKGRVEISGRAKSGPLRLNITADRHFFLHAQDLSPSPKRLFLGVSKKQDWDLILRRKDLAEIFPFWIRLSQFLPYAPLDEVKGTASLLKEGKLDAFVRSGFRGILSPRLNDELHQGILHAEPDEGSPLGLIHKGAELIEKLFFSEEGGLWKCLPYLPKEFHAGRFMHLKTEEGDVIHIEWSKKELKKAIIIPAATRAIQLGLQRRLKSYRLRTNPNQKGERKKRDEPLELSKGEKLYLDRFQH